jgi:hypothetical protein
MHADEVTVWAAMRAIEEAGGLGVRKDSGFAEETNPTINRTAGGPPVDHGAPGNDGRLR